MNQALPPAPLDPRASELITALNARAAARVELSWTLMEVEDFLSRPAPVPPRILADFETKMAKLRESQARVAKLTVLVP